MAIVAVRVATSGLLAGIDKDVGEPVIGRVSVGRVSVVEVGIPVLVTVIWGAEKRGTLRAGDSRAAPRLSRAMTNSTTATRLPLSLLLNICRSLL